jgi:predicted transcriptional regulator
MDDNERQSIFDLEPDRDHEARLDAEAEADYASGRVISHERVREWLMKLAKGKKDPPSFADE